MSERPKSDSPTVEVGTLAKLFNLTAVRVQQLAADGVVIKQARGRYDLWASIRNYIKFLQDRKLNQWDAGGDDGKGWARERERLTRAKADVAEIEAALLKGQSHDAAAVAKVWSDMIGNARTKLLAMPTKLAAQMEGMSIAERQDALREAINAALTELADYRPEVVTGEYVKTHRAEDAEAEEDDDAAAA
jgi:phage terminase Nu1 subunit (DNA packaging protein)